MRYRLGIDIGGTFTDFTVVDEHGTIVLDKAPSSRQNPASSIAAGLSKVAARLGLSAATFLDQCEDVVTHGSTVAVNTLIQHNGARVGLLCTEGFRDFMGMRGGHKERRYDFRYPPPPELVPRYLSVPVRERVDRDGAVVTPLHEEDVLAGIERFREEGVEAVAVCYLWSFRNPGHERRTGELLAEHLPEAYRSLSVDVLPQIRDYVRTSTTVVNAYLGPGVRRYVEEVREMFRTLGYEGDVRFMLSNGGAVAAEMLVRRPVASINSGPASGPIAGTYFGDLVGNRDVLTIDMGGTSFDISLVQSGQPRLVRNVDVHRYRVGVPMIDINTLGAGGGSIGWIDPSGILRVGPQSAESRPGPACYGHGGERPTVTDADLVLGYLDPDFFLGGEMALDRAAAETAIRAHVAEPLGLSIEEAAVGMFRVVNQNMVDGIREVSIERGYDPRDSVMVVGGGAGALHACPLAEELDLRHILVPRVASTLCAFGQLVADIKHDYTRSVLSQVGRLEPGTIPALFRELEAEAAADLAAEGADPASAQLRRSVDMRYVGQIHEVDVEIPGGDVSLDALVEAFHVRHEALYTYAERYSQAEVINVHLSASIARPPIPLPDRGAAGEVVPTPKGFRRAYTASAGFVEVPVYDGALLREGCSVAGPSIIEEVTTSIVVSEGWLATVDDRGAFDLRRPA